ncbi:hypothetical protein M422DRAFT_32836, partial [Sphaerobolus stellatus SS14]
MSDEVKNLIQPALSTFTALFLAGSLSAILVAMTIAQGTFYYRNYGGDSKLMKYFILSIVTFSSLQTGGLFYDIYFQFITCRLPENFRKLSGILVSVPFYLYLKYGLTFLTQCFYILRVWFVSGRRSWLAGILIVLSVIQLGTGIGQYIYSTSTGSISSVYAKATIVAQGVASTCTILCDGLVSSSLVYFLRENPILHQLARIGIGKITIYSINIGLVTVAVAIISLISWIAAPHPQFIWEIFFYPAAQVYVNSVLVSLNGRKDIRAQMITHYSHPHSSMFMSFNID